MLSFMSSVGAGRWRVGARLTVALAALALAACASVSGVAVGTDSAAVLAQFGAPTARHALPDGRQRWEYATGPEGRRTHMVDLRDGKVELVEQVLDEPHFNLIQVGQTESAVRALIGSPSVVSGAGLSGGALWSYRFESPFCLVFQLVVDHGRVREVGYGPDSRCRRPRAAFAG